MRLGDLAVVAGAALVGDSSVPVSGATLDSRRVRQGDLYAALPGATAHGADFVGQAVSSGASAVLTDAGGARRMGDAGVPVLVAADPRGVLGEVASAIYGRPSMRLQMIGVTGTNGKTTVTFLLDAALAALGATTGLVGTVETRVAGKRISSVRTTPESPDLQRLLAQMVSERVDVCAVEVSSHALALHRVDGVVFDIAGFTNLSQDHLDFHLTMEDYFATKASLFTQARSRRAVICIDDDWGRRLAGQATVPVTTLTTTGARVDDVSASWKVGGRCVAADGIAQFSIEDDCGRRFELRSPLPGDFNVANTAMAFVLLVEAGCEPVAVAQVLSSAGGVPGRMERVLLDDHDGWPGGQPLAVVDYAHTPEAVGAALRALRPATPGQLVVVLGAGGERDPGKREAMGRAAAGVADLVIVTDDNPRSEDPATIRTAVMSGAAAGAGDVVEIAGREAAIHEAVLRVDGPADTILVAGKGHETGQDIAGEIHPFDDRDILREALAQPSNRRAPA